MGKKVLVISSSPRKGGNSDLLCDEFIRGAMEAGHQAEKVFLQEKNINFCTGCGVCNSTHTCVQNDDMAGILEQMIRADVIVLATPVYFYTMDGQLKTMIDRTVPRYTEIAGKEFYFIVTAADTKTENLKRTVESLRGFTQECLPDPKERGILYAAGVWQKGDVQGTPFVLQAYEMGRNI